MSKHKFENELLEEDMVMPILQKTSTHISQSIKERVHLMHEPK